MIHRIKRITFFQRTVPILLQNENGPCPLLAICNGLLLSGKITLPAGRMEITTDSLVQLIANHLFSHPTLHSSDDNIRINAQKSVDDVIQILPAFAVGLDVNCKFNCVDAFEFTQQLTTFDLTDLRLLHGWTYDPQDTRSAQAIGTMSYNQLIEQVITLRSTVEDLECIERAQEVKEDREENKDKEDKEDSDEENEAATLEQALLLSTMKDDEPAPPTPPTPPTTTNNQQPTTNNAPAVCFPSAQWARGMANAAKDKPLEYVNS
jgi:hypothetical protein